MEMAWTAGFDNPGVVDGPRFLSTFPERNNGARRSFIPVCLECLWTVLSGMADRLDLSVKKQCACIRSSWCTFEGERRSNPLMVYLTSLVDNQN